MSDLPIDFSHLRYFQTVARCGSLSAAARVLGISQPALTRAVRGLEERLKTTLLLRDRTGVSLTRGGELLLRHAADVFTALDRAERELAGLETGDAGSFVIGCHESLGAYFLPDFMAEFLDAHPRIELVLWNGSSADVERAVLDRVVHFGLVVNPHAHPDVVQLALFGDAVDVLVSAELELSPETGRLLRRPREPRKEGPIDLDLAHAMLRAGPLIFAGRVSQCRALLEQLAERQLVPARVLNCGDLELVKALALAGVGVALLPRRVASYGNDGRLVRLHPELPHYPDVISLVYRADLHRTTAARRLKDALVRYGRGLERQR